MRVQLWSYNYVPEPQGIAPLSAMLAQGLQALGHEVSVVAAHPHYPEPAWGHRGTPYRQVIDGIPVMRLPLWVGRDTAIQRIRQELTYTAAHFAATPFVKRPDVVIAVTPSFPALTVAMAYCKLRRLPWVMWLQDIVTDGAETTGELPSDGALLRAARRFEVASYRSASRIVVISDAFRENLIGKGVDADKIRRIFNPTSRTADAPNDVDALMAKRPQVLAMGNIGHSQGLDRIVNAFEGSDELSAIDAELSIVGSGVAADRVRSEITGPRVQMPGVLYGDELLPALRGASIGLVSQRGDIAEFNLPSKLMNYMTHGVPVLASVNPASETARIVRESGCGWVTDAADPSAFARQAAAVLRDPVALSDASARGFAFAQREFSPTNIATKFADVLVEATGRDALGASAGFGAAAPSSATAGPAVGDDIPETGPRDDAAPAEIQARA